MVSMKSRLLVACVSTWEIEGRQGISMTYLADPSAESTTIGKVPVKITGDKEAYPGFVAPNAVLPGTFEVELSMSPGAGGKAKMKVLSARFIGQPKE